MSRKVGALARSRIPQSARAQKSKGRKKPVTPRSAARRQETSVENPAATAIRPPPPGEGKRGEQGYLAYLLRQAQGATRLAMERSLADLGVTTPQFVVLTMLRAYPGLSGADLARVAMLTPQTVGVIIRNLERAGAIRKTPHPVHGRVLQWTVTPRGAALLEKCRRHAQAIERRLAAGLSDNAQRLIRRWLAKIAADL
ncbi:MarR family transcriptional regulator [Bradyrhizobium sp. WSM 1738]|uniref:MarR family winged helix-turn-helix transcriptional regulator n=1 Tax=Bradyrhizobium hereditatis TaxID=2821405 RepID=UPI001CE33E2F|nr:MarR family transcriptional regulator [Bradyrhizobium hereditatis]MCA6113701.1 MarR family transcriptional regulator [Bradyrhizobium hereditatis]